jgi:nucleoside-diphosphate-sugar epimerase
MGNGRAVQMQELAEAVMAAAPEARIELQPGENPKGNPSDHFLDLTRVKDEFGYEPQYPIVEKGIADYIAWLRTHDQ